MSDYPLCTLKRAKKSGRRKGIPCGPTRQKAHPQRGGPAAVKGGTRRGTFLHRGAERPRNTTHPFAPQNHLQENLRILPPLSFFCQHTTKRAGRQERSWTGRGRRRLGGLPPGYARLPGRPRGRPAGRPYIHQEHTPITVPALPAGTYHGGVRPRPTNRRKRHIVLQTFRQVVGAACMPPGRRSCGNAVLQADSPFSDVP